MRAWLALARALREQSARQARRFTAASTANADACKQTAIEGVRHVCSQKRHYFVHFGNLLVVGAINQTDMLNLRSLMIVSSVFGIAFNLLQPKPLIAPACWGAFFISVHAYYISVLLRERQNIVMSGEQEQAYEMAFLKFGFTPRQFYDILEQARARWCTFSRGAYLHRKGDVMKEISFLLEGEMKMLNSSGEVLRTVEPGKGGWLGEFFDPDEDEHHRSDRACATEGSCAQHRHCVSWMCSSEQCRTLTLSRAELHDHLTANPRLKEAAFRSQLDDLWGKLKSSLPESRRNAYRQMLQVATSDGVLCPSELQLLKGWREKHEISASEHAAMLAEIGWSEEDFVAGKQRRKWLKGH